MIAKNYLNGEELDQLNRLVSMFLDFAELRAKQREHIKLDDWCRYIDSFMAFNEQPMLRTAGSVSHEQMKNVAHERYEAFDQKRRSTEAREIDVKELAELEHLEKRLSSHKKPT